MNYYTNQDFSYKVKKSIREYLNQSEFLEPYSVTLTMKQFLQNEKLDEIKSSENLKYFLNRLNYKIFKNRFRRFNKKLRVIPILENSLQERLHYHLLIDKPKNLSDIYFRLVIDETFKKTRFSYDDIEIKKQIEPIFYFSSYVTKMKNRNIVDFLNMSI